MPKTKLRNKNTFNRPCIDTNIVRIKSFIAASLLMDFSGLSTRAARKVFRKPGFIFGMKSSKLISTMAKSSLFHGSLK